MSVPRHIIDDIDFYIKCRDKRSDWAKKSQKWFNFCILNRQWTRNEKEQLKDRGHAPLVINRMKPATRLYKHYLGASSPTIKTIPLRMPDLADVTSEQMSKVYNTIFTHIWYNNSHGDQENAKVIEDMLVRGVGYWFIKHDKMINDGEGGIVIKSLDPLDVFIDPNSREPDLTDAEGIVISKKVSANLVRQLFPKKWQVIKKAINRYTDDSNLPATPEWSESGVHYYDEVYDEEVHEVRLFDVYRREVVKIYEIVNLKTGDYYELNEREYEKFEPKAKGILDYEKKEKRVKVEKAQDKHEVQNNLNEKVAFVRYGFIDEFRKIASKLTAVKRYAKAHPMKALLVALAGPAAAVEAYRNIESLEDIENKFNEKFPGEGLSLKDPNPKHIKFLSKVSE